MGLRRLEGEGALSEGVRIPGERRRMIQQCKNQFLSASLTVGPESCCEGFMWLLGDYRVLLGR